MKIKSRIKKIFHSFKMIRKAYSSIQNYRRMMNYEYIVRQFDKDIDTNKWDGSIFLKNFFVPRTLDRPTIFDEFGFNDSHCINFEHASIAAFVTLHFKKFIIEYLGEKVRLDNIVLSWFDPALCLDDKSISGAWHNDNVGHRLKIYMYERRRIYSNCGETTHTS